ncbi:hypothetical protein BDE02_19G073900 [Populus trichocarpa]|nr:hypothetical protein BDE02_19G073900 [Populus trichocarpa]
MLQFIAWSYTLYWSLQFLYDAGATSVRYFDLRYMFRSHQIKASENCSCLKEPCDFNSCCTLRAFGFSAIQAAVQGSVLVFFCCNCKYATKCDRVLVVCCAKIGYTYEGSCI